MLFVISALLLAAGCTKHEVAVPPPKGGAAHPEEVARPVAPRVMEIQRDSAIDSVMREARQGDIDHQSAQQQLQQLAATAPPILADEARFRAVELQLEWDDPYADAAADRLLQARPDHALVPYLHFWLSGWLLRRDARAAALDHLALTIDGSTTPPDLRHRALREGARAVAALEDGEAVQWLLSRMPHLDDEDRLTVARMAAVRSSPEMVAAWRQQVTEHDPFAAYYQEVARIALMRGDRDTLRQVADWAADDIPETGAARMIHRWHSGSSRAVRIGVLLPLSGRYAHFGERALHGVRMAVSKLRYGDNITLIIADSGGNANATISGYQRLLAEGCVAVVGPLLANDVRALAPALRPDVPVMALTNQRALARLAPSLFVHSVGPQVQAAFLAELVRRQLRERARLAQPLAQPQVAVIASADASSQASADLFQRLLEADGVAKVHRLTVDGAIDERGRLLALRRDSDDALLLDELDEDLALFIAEPDLAPMLPPGLAAVYLPLRGKEVAALAGQLAYVGLNQVEILGDSRWRDGHLFDDHGRYLAKAAIAALPSADQARQQTVFSAAPQEEYRQLWGDHARSLLSDVAFDSLVVEATLTSSWGLQGMPLVRALRDPGGFPLPTGNVVFDHDGIGHKGFALLTVRDGALVPLK